MRAAVLAEDAAQSKCERENKLYSNVQRLTPSCAGSEATRRSTGELAVIDRVVLSSTQARRQRLCTETTAGNKAKVTVYCGD